MNVLAAHLRERLELKAHHQLIEIKKMRAVEGASLFDKKMFELRDGANRVLGLYDTWLVEERGNGFFGYFRYSAEGDLLGYRTFILRNRSV